MRYCMAGLASEPAGTDQAMVLLLIHSLQRSNHRVSLPTIDDGDWGKYASPSDRLSFETFIATCKLTKLIE